VIAGEDRHDREQNKPVAEPLSKRRASGNFFGAARETEKHLDRAFHAAEIRRGK